MEFRHLNGRAGYLPNPVNIGVIQGETGVILVDTGLDDETAKRILKCLDKEGLRVNAIINTHSHSDHFGGNARITAAAGASVYVPEVEDRVLENPYLEPLFLFSGAWPLKELQNKFLMGKPSKVDYIIRKEDRSVIIDGVTIDILPLPGHSLNQVGVGIDGVLYCADSVFSQEVIKRHRLPFCVDIASQKETLSMLQQTSFSFYVPSHGEPVTDIGALAEAYRSCIASIEEAALELLSTPLDTPAFVKALCDRVGLVLKGLSQYYLMHSVAVSYLGYLHNEGKILSEINENRLFWRRL